VFEVAAPGELKLDDDWAKTLGMDSLDALKGIVKQQIESQNGGQTRQKVKRQLLDALDAQYPSSCRQRWWSRSSTRSGVRSRPK
jgi:FKBP-type peptidyl-prolyl cis-trans isomerase (trigger factor)